MNGDALFQGNHRLWLLRQWDEDKPMVMYIGLNPSIADGESNDPTITRLINFSKEFGFGGFYMVNLFSVIATSPYDMKKTDQSNHHSNDMLIRFLSKKVKEVVFCWGTHGAHLNRSSVVSKWFPHAKCFKKTKEGHPQHPLYLRSDTQLINFHKP